MNRIPVPPAPQHCQQPAAAPHEPNDGPIIERAGASCELSSAAAIAAPTSQSAIEMADVVSQQVGAMLHARQNTPILGPRSSCRSWYCIKTAHMRGVLPLPSAMSGVCLLSDGPLVPSTRLCVWVRPCARAKSYMRAPCLRDEAALARLRARRGRTRARHLEAASRRCTRPASGTCGSTTPRKGRTSTRDAYGRR